MDKEPICMNQATCEACHGAGKVEATASYSIGHTPHLVKVWFPCPHCFDHATVKMAEDESGSAQPGGEE